MCVFFKGEIEAEENISLNEHVLPNIKKKKKVIKTQLPPVGLTGQ